jgi:uncharacterized membrane protein YhhN
MGILQIQDRKISVAAVITSLIFLAGSILYYLPLEIPHKVTIPLATLTIASVWLCPWQMTLAFLFSAIGDYFGSCNNFILQMGSFAVAHVWLIVYFASRYFKKVEHDKKLTAKAKGYFAMVIFCTIALLAMAFSKIVPAAEPGIIKTGVSIYACLIGAMMLTALLQRSSVFAIGAVLFVFSDFILAWNMFVEPVPYSRYLILITYYAAQWFLFIRATPLRIAPEMRLLRF